MIFKGVSMRSKKVLASKSFYLKYPANTVVVKQGDQVYNIYLLSKGSAVVVRRCEKRSIEKYLR
jgi:CRP-like cAMP-binding protein